MLLGLLLLGSLSSPARAECDDSLDTLDTFLDQWVVDSTRGIHTNAAFPDLVLRTPDRTVSSPHNGATLDVSAYGAHLGELQVGKLTGSPMAQTRLIEALMADPTLGRGLKDGQPEYRHILLGLHPDAVWSSLVTVSNAATALGLDSLSMAYAAPDLPAPPPSAQHTWFEELNRQPVAGRVDFYTKEIRSQASTCAALAPVFGDSAPLERDARPALFRSRLHGAYLTCRCHAADPMVMAELFWNLDGQHRVWLSEIKISPTGTPVPFPASTPWRDAEAALWAASAGGPVWPVNSAQPPAAAPAPAPATPAPTQP